MDLKKEWIERDNGSLELAVFSKSTSTDRFITNDSFCTRQNKLAAFHSMVHRLSLNEMQLIYCVGCKTYICRYQFQNYKKKYEQIVYFADLNGFEKSIVDNLVRKHSNKLKKELHTTLFSQNKSLQDANEYKVAVMHAPSITNCNLQKAFERSNMRMVHTNTNKLKCSLGSTKVKIPFEQKSGFCIQNRQSRMRHEVHRTDKESATLSHKWAY